MSGSNPIAKLVSVASTDLDACVTCGMCLNVCPTFQLSGMEGYSPRGRIVALRNQRDGVAEMSPVLTDYLDTCLGCRACESVCPSGVPYGRILEHAREERPPGSKMHQRLERVMLWFLARRWRLSVASLPLWFAQRTGLLRVAIALARKGLLPKAVAQAAGMPKIRFLNLSVRLATNYTPPEGVPERGQVVLFAGCVQDAWNRDIHWATINVLTRAGYRVRIPRDQVCCGALHAHAGQIESARKLIEANVEPLERYEGEIVINSAGCGAKIKEWGELVSEERVEALAARARDVSEVLTPADIRALGPRPPAGLSRVAFHDACHLNFVQRISSGPRELLRAAGYDVLDLPDGGRCCGAAGSYAVTHPEWAMPLRDAKMEAVASVTPDAVAVGNPGCHFWLQAADDAPPMYHPIQLIAMAIANARDD